MRQKSNKHGGHSYFYFSHLSIILLIFQFQLSVLRTIYILQSTYDQLFKKWKQ